VADDPVLLSFDDGVAVLTFDRPDNRRRTRIWLT